MPQDAAGCHPNARDDGAPVPRYKARPRPEGDSGFLGPGRGSPSRIQGLETKVKLSDQFRNSLGLRQNFGRESEPDRPTSAKTHIVSAGVGRCVIHPLLNGLCVSPANTGWDWLEFRPANAALRSGLSSAAPVIALKKFPLPMTL